MKKIIIIALIIAILAILVVGACGCYETTPHNTIQFSDRFIILKERTTGNTVYVAMYDKHTKVMYVYIKLSNSGNLTVLVNSDGTPMLYEENK